MLSETENLETCLKCTLAFLWWKELLPCFFFNRERKVLKEFFFILMALAITPFCGVEKRE